MIETTCGACGEPIFWVRGKQDDPSATVPLNVTPERRIVMVMENRMTKERRVVDPHTLGAVAEVADAFVIHFDTCSELRKSG